jgi:hypothetical protein
MTLAIQPPTFLLNEKEQIFPARQAFLHPVRAAAQHHASRPLERSGGFQDVFQKASTGRPVKDFGQIGFHPGAFPGRENKNVDGIQERSFSLKERRYFSKISPGWGARDRSW